LQDDESVHHHPWAGPPNGSIPLSKTAVKLAVGEAATRLSATPTLRLLPHPSIIFTFSGAYSGRPWIDPPDPPFKLMPQGVKLPLTVAGWSISAGKVSGTLIAIQEPCTVSPTSERLQSVHFAVLNFPLFFGGQDRAIECEGRLRRVYRWLAAPWQLEMTEVPDLEAVQKTLENDGGYAVTYTGACSRSDGEAFTVGDAEHLLEILRLFLSFARGAFCSLPLRAGVDADGNKIWEQWGNQPVEPWLGKPWTTISWFDTMHGEILPQVFPGFWHLLEHLDRNDAVRTALYWYLRSNAGGRSPGVDGGLILSQAALERLSSTHTAASAYAPAKPKKDPASKLFRKTLENMEISIKIPCECQVLLELARLNNWEDGPHALTKVRNNLVHPKLEFNALPNSSFEAWNLSQYYIELMLLRLCGYKGQYANRLKLGRWRGVVEPVPWA
jgi:hypothetical protein